MNRPTGVGETLAFQAAQIAPHQIALMPGTYLYQMARPVGEVPVEIVLPTGSTLSLGPDQLQVGARVHLNGPSGPAVGVIVAVRNAVHDAMDVEIMLQETVYPEAMLRAAVPPWFEVNAHFRVRADGSYWVVRSIGDRVFHASAPVQDWPRRDFTFQELERGDFDHFDTKPPPWLRVGAQIEDGNRKAVVMGVLGWRIVCRGVEGDPRLTTSTNFFGEHCELILPEVLAYWKPVGTMPKAPPAVPAGPRTRFDREDVL